MLLIIAVPGELVEDGDGDEGTSVPFQGVTIQTILNLMSQIHIDMVCKTKSAGQHAHLLQLHLLVFFACKHHQFFIKGEPGLL